MADFILSGLFSDHAVFARNKEIRIFGKAKRHTALKATLISESGETLGTDQSITEGEGFLLFFPPQRAQTGCRLLITDGDTTNEYRDIAIGDVYLAGGQSNMELELQNADEGKDLIRTHNNPLVRYYNVPKRAREGDETEQANMDARWVSIEPGTAADMSAAAYFFAMKLQFEIDVPVGIIDCYWGGTSITCWMDEETLNESAEGQRFIREYEEASRGKTMADYLREEDAFNAEMKEWSDAADLLKKDVPNITPQQLNERLGPFPWHPPVGPGSPFRPHGLYDVMFRRIVPYGLTGVLFYQGEADTWRTEKYEGLLTAFILRLRALFMDPNLPFLNVQLPMWIEKGAADSKTWPRLRMEQYRTYCNLRNTGLAVLLDQGEFDNIHPTNKRVVGERLYLEALRVVYHRNAAQAVFAIRKHTAGNILIVHLSAEVMEEEQGEYLMEIAGQDGVFYPASVIIQHEALYLHCPRVTRPIKARYAWTDYAIVRLFGTNGLPLAPFYLE